MMTTSRWCLFCLIALGCGQPSGPSGTTLRGEWGAAGEDPARLIALNIGAELHLACSSVVTSSPVPLSPDNSFVFRGRYYGSGAGSPLRALVRGSLVEESVRLSVDLEHDGDPAFSYTLQRDVDPRFEDLEVFCPQ